MTEIEFKWLTEPLAVLLTGKGVFIVSIVIAVIFGFIYYKYLQPIITQYFIDNKSEIWLLFLIAHSKR